MAMDFHSLVPPYLHIVPGDGAAIGRYAYRIASQDQSLAVRVVRGRKMQTREALFDEFSAAFQFPYYFGQNWDAFDECLADLEWLPAQGYLLVVVDATAVLTHEEDTQFEIFAETLSDICAEWAQAEIPKPFHVVLHCNPEEVLRLQQHFGSARLEEL